MIDKTFSSHLVDNIKYAKHVVKNNYNLVTGNNIDLICEKLHTNKSMPGCYAECGVFQGNTFFAIAEFLKSISQTRMLYGFDTFSGFPNNNIDERDKPSFFKTLLDDGLITEDHYCKAAVRTHDFTDIEHLTGEYFVNVGNIFDIARDYKNTQLIKGTFKNSLAKFDEPICVLFIDCDLYQSYMDCLALLFSKVLSGGVIIFDEYYSLKYPGARLAVSEFFKDKEGSFEKYITSDGFERVCFVKD